jgi:preprotein translocase subunit SecD
LRTEDVTDAIVAMYSSNGAPDVYMAATHQSVAAKSFEDATRQSIQRRIAILIDDEIN